MENKIGLTDIKKIKEIEYYLFNTKYHIIDENYTFNVENIFSTDYLEKIHIFLFNDVYFEEDCKIRSSLPEETIININQKLNELKLMLIYDQKKGIKELIYDIWEKQIFYDGNTRTLLCFLKILSRIFNLKVNYDFKKDIYKDYFIDEVIESIEEEQKIK